MSDNHGTDIAVVSPKELQEKLTKRLQPLLRNEKVGELKLNVRQAVVETTTMIHGGPLPPPEQFKEYNSILPGSADRILKMAEKEQDYRHDWDRKHIRWDGTIAVAGLSFGWLLSMALAGGAIYCASIDQPWVAGALTGFAAFGGVANLIQGKRLFGKADHQMPVEAPKNTPGKASKKLPSPRSSQQQKRKR